MGNLSNLYISRSFQSLIHLGSDSTVTSGLTTLQDGYGNSIGIEVNNAGDLYLSGSLTASLQNGYVWVGNSSGKTSLVATSSFGGGGSSDLTQLNQATASLQAFTASANIRLTNLETTTASLNVSITNLNASSASQQVSINALNIFTASANQRLTAIESVSGSWITESETASFARTNIDNNFSTSQTIVGAITASAAKIAGLNYPSADNGAESFIQTDGAGNLSLQYVKTMYQNIRNMESVTISKGTPLFVSGSTGDNANVYIADAGNPLRMPATLIAGDTTLAPAATGKGIIFGHIDGVDTSAYTPGTEVYVGVGGGWTSTRPTGSTTPIQPLGVVTRQGNNGMGIVMTETPYDLPNIQTGYVWVGNGNNQPVSVATSSFIDTFNSSSLLITASASPTANTITFTKGDASTFDVVLNITASASASFNTSSFATTGSNTFTGNQLISLSGGEFQITNPSQPTYGTVAFGLSNAAQGGIYFKQSGSIVIEGAPANGTLTFYATGSFGKALQIGVPEQFGNNAFIMPTGSTVMVAGPVGSDKVGVLLFGKANDGTPTRFAEVNVTIDKNLIITGSLTASIAQGYTWVGDASGKTSLVSTSSFGGGTIDTSSLAVLGANQTFTGNNTFVGNTVVSQSAHFGTASFFAPMVISNGIVGDVDLTGSLVANKVGAFDFDSIFLGSQLGGSTANGTFFGYGSTSYTSTLGAYAGGFDNELQTYIDNTGIYLKDFNGSGYDTFLKLLPNTGINPAPEFVRGVNITGSLGLSGSFRQTGQSYISGNVYVSGSINLAGDGANGHAFSGKALFLTNSVQTGITIESPIHFYQVGKGDMYIQNNVSGVGSGSMNIIAANGANLNISASNLVSTAAKTTINTGDLQVGRDPAADIYNGFKVDRNGADLNNYTIFNLATSSAILDLGAVDGTGFSYSTELYVEATPSSVKFKDFSIGDYAYHDWLTIPQNTGSNPKPIFNRGIEVTGSVNISQVMNLKPQNPLPAGTIGDLAVSGSNLFFYNGAWTQIV